MELNSFVRLYQEFLKEGTQKGWLIEVLIEEFGSYLATIKNSKGIEVQFFMELDLENPVQYSESRNQSRLEYGVIREKEEEDSFAREVLEAFHQYWEKQPRKKMNFFLYKPQ